MEKEATGVLLAEDFTTDSDPQANGSKEQLTHHSGINPVIQLSDDTAGVFKTSLRLEFIKTLSGSHDHLTKK